MLYPLIKEVKKVAVPIYQIISQHSGKYLDILESSTNVGAKVIQRYQKVCIFVPNSVDGTGIFHFIKLPSNLHFHFSLMIPLIANSGISMKDISKTRNPV